MDLGQGIATFFVIWWTFIFCVLPWGNRPSEDPIPGETGNIPAHPRILKKFCITTVLACVVWLIVYGLIEVNVIDFYALAHDMIIKDGLQ